MSTPSPSPSARSGPRPADPPAVAVAPPPGPALPQEQGFGPTHGPVHRTQSADDFDAQRVHKEIRKPLFFGAISQLDAPPPRPGMEQRWVRTGGIDLARDAANVRRKMARFGYSPRLASSVPEDYPFVPSVKFGSYGDVVGMENLVLMERPIEIGRQHREFLRAQSARLTQTVKPFVRNGQNSILAQANLGPRFGSTGAVVEEMKTHTSAFLEEALRDG